MNSFNMAPTCRTNMTSLIDEEVVEEVLAFGFQWNDVEVAVARLLSCRFNSLCKNRVNYPLFEKIYQGCRHLSSNFGG
uniref:Uncharacterized protein n=1 Tax=Magallana gigas TaxID=29159 RepID=K1QH23_MAGGI